MMILVFLANWRSTRMIATWISLAILCLIITLSAIGQTINIMTLGGLALAVGILVDDASVEVENINRNREAEPHKPKAEKEPTKYWLPNLPAAITLHQLVATAKLLGHIERDYEELKQELGLGHFEGRNWRGFHHHASLSMAYGFLVMERCLLPPRPAGRELPTFNFAYPNCHVERDYAALPVRTERHNPHSIATLRRQLATHSLDVYPVVHAANLSVSNTVVLRACNKTSNDNNLRRDRLNTSSGTARRHSTASRAAWKTALSSRLRAG